MRPTLIHRGGRHGGRGHGLRPSRGRSGPKDVGKGGISLIVVIRVLICSLALLLSCSRVVVIIRHVALAEAKDSDPLAIVRADREAERQPVEERLTVA